MLLGFLIANLICFLIGLRMLWKHTHPETPPICDTCSELIKKTRDDPPRYYCPYHRAEYCDYYCAPPLICNKYKCKEYRGGEKNGIA